MAPDFKQGDLSQPELVLGNEMKKYMKDAFAASSVFHDRPSEIMV